MRLQPVRTHEAERVGDHRGAPVGAHDEAARDVDGRARGVVEPHARHPARLHAQPGDAVTLARVQRKLPRPLVEDVVEPMPAGIARPCSR